MYYEGGDDDIASVKYYLHTDYGSVLYFVHKGDVAAGETARDAMDTQIKQGQIQDSHLEGLGARTHITNTKPEVPDGRGPGPA